MNHWFRLYNTLVDDPKVQQLPDALFKALVNLWCVASQNDGVLPSADDIGYKLRIKPQRAAEIVTRLVQAGLIDKVDGVFIPHNWDSRQFQSDSSTDRVKKHREKKKRNVSGNVSETANETDRAEQNKSEQSTADARTLDEKGLKQERALIDLFTALCANLGHPKPDMKPISVWLLDGIAFGTISEVCQAIIRRKSDMASLSYCDAAVREKHRGVQSAPSLSPVPMNDSDWDAVVKRWKSNQSLWPRGVGGEPGMLGCRCPANILNDNLVDPVTGRTLSEPLVFVHEQTDEMAAWCHHAQVTGRKPPIVFEIEIDGVVKRGAYMPKLTPDDYDFTGERLSSVGEVNVA